MSKWKEWAKYEGVYIIPVMGPTGAGKSSFINRLAGREIVRVAHGLQPCTVDLQPVPIAMDLVQSYLPLWTPEPQNGAKLIIVDTPGSDDIRADDSEILKRVADWLTNTYGAGAKLAGVVYLHDICQRRVPGAVKLNFEVFDKLCGPGACKAVVLGTTQWQKLHRDDHVVAKGREEVLRDHFWRDMIKKGSTMKRVDYTGADRDLTASAWKLIETVLYKGESPTLVIQKELQDLHKSLPQTEAAAVLRGRIEELIKSLKNAGATKEELKALQAEVAALKEKSKPARFFAPMSKGKEWAKYEGVYIIPVMGPTGAGKSFFINQLLGKRTVQVGDSLQSCTVDLQPVPIPSRLVEHYLPSWTPEPQNGAQLIIVDTPGFDDTSADDSEILRRVADWLSNTYGAGAKLAGVIYLQEIIHCRVTGTTKKNFEVFDKLCGSGACKSVVLGTTKWGEVQNRSLAMGREGDLRDNFWKDMIKKGSTMKRVDDTNTATRDDRELRALAWKLIETVVYKGESPTLCIQTELWDLQKTLPQTEAAAVLRARIEELIKSLKNTGATKEELKALQAEVAALKEKSKLARFFEKLNPFK